MHVLRYPQVDLSSLLASPEPHIDLRLSAYDASTRNFLKAVSSYKNRALTTLAERRASHAAEKKRILDRTQAAVTETNQCKLREIDLVATLEREKEERKDAELEVAALKRQLASLREKSEMVGAEIEKYRASTANLRRERTTERNTLSTHAAHISPGVEAIERALGCMVEGIGADQVLLRFAHLDPANPDRECSLVLDVAQGYKVATASPPLPTLPLLLKTLNETRGFYAFVRDVRMAYQTLLDNRS
ncbi:putative kinetochore protein SPC25 [Termitomyces sp. T112]|nr:hypothetical protein C0989_003918 [Termitomyces sp. Mn162]KAG5720294.1 putative kinetochore protein SPC25 [Termitomyces sp. T112]KAH0590112.1 hypothetical protein H2248_000289 [Termitomyces sp. 'cryptogamus']KNZ79353.1 putative kinetochore protein SPC25 [Termitomyces sp. J132]